MSEVGPRNENCCVAAQRIVITEKQFSSNPWPVIKADDNDAFAHEAVFLVSVCNLFRVIGSPQWRAGVLGRSQQWGCNRLLRQHCLDRCMSLNGEAKNRNKCVQLIQKTECGSRVQFEFI